MSQPQPLHAFFLSPQVLYLELVHSLLANQQAANEQSTNKEAALSDALGALGDSLIDIV